MGTGTSAGRPLLLPDMKGGLSFSAKMLISTAVPHPTPASGQQTPPRTGHPRGLTRVAARAAPRDGELAFAPCPQTCVRSPRALVQESSCPEAGHGWGGAQEEAAALSHGHWPGGGSDGGGAPPEGQQATPLGCDLRGQRWQCEGEVRAAREPKVAPAPRSPGPAAVGPPTEAGLAPAEREEGGLLLTRVGGMERDVCPLCLCGKAVGGRPPLARGLSRQTS